ncbi:glycosyl transferases group 1 family protein [Lysobacter antibioticus]|uniref:Glycosyl transferases group 1 family protein n=1 Tax=Lysobacter antibioticus TaxID=84531 RepID=A0A0S2F707_LYSAN|nr:glycosyl transferases group 1 family protein [Lysobacter antibioticus]
MESIPVVFSDAMKFSIPVISMPVGDLPALIGCGTGWLAKSVDASAFASAIGASLLSGHDDAAIRAVSDRFAIEKIARRIVFATQKAGTAASD